MFGETLSQSARGEEEKNLCACADSNCSRSACSMGSLYWLSCCNFHYRLVRLNKTWVHKANDLFTNTFSRIPCEISLLKVKRECFFGNRYRVFEYSAFKMEAARSSEVSLNIWPMRRDIQTPPLSLYSWYPLCRKQGWPQSLSEPYGEERNLLSLQEIEPRFLDRPTHSPVTIPTEL
jgi:hypothetical protein